MDLGPQFTKENQSKKDIKQERMKVWLFLSLFPKRRKVMSYFRSIRLSRHAVISRLSIQGTETKDMTWDCWRGKLILKYSAHLQEVTKRGKSKLQSKMVHLNPNTPATTLNINTFLDRELKKWGCFSLPISFSSLLHQFLSPSLSHACSLFPSCTYTHPYKCTHIQIYAHTNTLILSHTQNLNILIRPWLTTFSLTLK